MKSIEMVMPPMGESIFECTVLKWLVKEGDYVDEDDMVIEVATDKIDTEIGSSMKGIVEKFLVKEGEIAKIGYPICLIKCENGKESNPFPISTQVEESSKVIENQYVAIVDSLQKPFSSTHRFLSPLVQNIIKKEGISEEELEYIKGTGLENRITKNDILAYVDKRGSFSSPKVESTPVSSSFDEIIEMDRMRKMIAARMVESKKIAPHVTSFVETDMTRLFNWRNKIKSEFQAKTNENITFTPLLVEAVAKAIQDFPMMNIQVEGERIIKKKDINIGIAVALPNGNLIVPVIKNADTFNLVGLTKKINDLANRARQNRLEPSELSGGTFTISNIGSFGNISGTPIILQPQVGILAFGIIRKVPAVIETPDGDVIGIRQQMIVSHSYDHRVIDGSLGGMFVKRVSDYLEQFDTKRAIF